MSQGSTTATLDVGNHAIRVECADGITLHAPADAEYELWYSEGDYLHTAFLSHPCLDDETDIVSFKEVTHDSSRDTLHLYHLNVPHDLRGRGFGKLAIALQCAICTLNDHAYFSIKFADADSHNLFLEHLGFPSRFIDRVQDTDHVFPSAVVGRVKRDLDGPSRWAIDPVELRQFPTQFFDLRVSETPVP